jgi:hypothetical protein
MTFCENKDWNGSATLLPVYGKDERISSRASERNPSPEKENAVAFHAIEQCFVLLLYFNTTNTDILLMPDHLKETHRSAQDVLRCSPPEEMRFRGKHPAIGLNGYYPDLT